MTFLLNTGRTIRQGKHIESKGATAYSDETSLCYLHPVDLMDLGIEEGMNVIIRGSAGETVFRTVADEGLSKGMAFVPYGPFANVVISAWTHSTGMPDFKIIEVEIFPTEKPRISALELMEEMGGVRYENR